MAYTAAIFHFFSNFHACFINSNFMSQKSDYFSYFFKIKIISKNAIGASIITENSFVFLQNSNFSVKILNILF